MRIELRRFGASAPPEGPGRIKGLAAVLLATLLLATPALADHVFSHRLVVEGRLVGADGLPLPGREVEFFSEGQDFLEPCRGPGHARVTDEFGDFWFCFHHHELSSGARVGVRSENATTIKPVDIAFRRMLMFLRDTEENGTAPPGWNSTYRLSGRAWSVGPTTLEGVPVFGVAAIDVEVNLTVRAQDNTTTLFHSRTDGFGDYDIVVETAEPPANLSVTAEALGRSQPVQLDAIFHRTYAPIYLPGAMDAPQPGPFASPVVGGSSQAPGSTTPKADPVLFVAAAIGLALAILLSRRK